MNEYEQQADMITRASDTLSKQCQKYKGAQYTACIEAVQAKMAQQATKRLPGFADGGLVNQQGTQQMNQPKVIDITPQMAATMAPKGYAMGGPVQAKPKPLVTPEMIAAIAPKGYAAGGNVEQQMSDMMPQKDPMMADDMYEPQVDSSDAVDAIASFLNEEEVSILNMALNDYPELIPILDKAQMATSGEFTGEGEVNGPGTETSDSIPARLSDGEFVFTAKAVKQIGVDKLRKMMAKAEADYDGDMDTQEENQMEDEGFFLGGLLDQTRKEWADTESASTDFNQPENVEKPVNVDGMGRQVPEGTVGIMARREVDLAKEGGSNTNARAMTSSTGLLSANSMETEQARANTQQKLKKATEEDNKQLDMFAV
jgi:hypothetical protein